MAVASGRMIASITSNPVAGMPVLYTSIFGNSLKPGRVRNML